jgi:flagellar motor switch protein FliN/FliY
MADENETDLALPRLEENEPGSEAPTVTRGAPVPKVPSDLEQLFDVPVTVSAVLGHARMAIQDLLKIGPGSLLELDRRVGEAIDILVNNRLVARGEVVLVDERLGVTMTEIVRADS